MASKSPDAFRTISEVADWLGVQPHVLRFWESKFSQVKPVKRAGGRRYYRPADMQLLGGIRKLLHEDGLTIKGAQKVLREEGMAHVAEMSPPLDPEDAAAAEVLDFPEPLPAAEAPAPRGAPPQPEPEAARTAPEDLPDPAADAADPAPPPELPGGLPSFLHPEAGAPETSPEATAPEPAETPPESPPATPPAHEDPLPAQADTPAEDAAADESLGEPESLRDQAGDLPAFLRKPLEGQPDSPDVPPPAPPEHGTGKAAGELPVGPDVSPAPDSPKPQIVEAPDPDESTYSLSPAALSAAYGTSRIDAAQRAQLTPLVARLAALRDRMAAASGR